MCDWLRVLRLFEIRKKGKRVYLTYCGECLMCLHIVFVELDLKVIRGSMVGLGLQRLVLFGLLVVQLVHFDLLNFLLLFSEGVPNH